MLTNRRRVLTLASRHQTRLTIAMTTAATTTTTTIVSSRLIAHPLPAYALSLASRGGNVSPLLYAHVAPVVQPWGDPRGRSCSRSGIRHPAQCCTYLPLAQHRIRARTTPPRGSSHVLTAQESS